jgi:transcriptional accessory protein Tex/SPT6
MSDGHIARPSDVTQVGDEVEVRVIKVNQKRNRIELSMVGLPTEEDTEVEDDSEEPALTAMELAWRSAMQREGMSMDVSTTKRGRRRRKADIRRQQAQIIARTLKSQDK